MLIMNRQRQREEDDLVEAYAVQRLGRRTFLRRAMETGLSLSAATALLEACTEASAPASIDVLSLWSDEERASFLAVVAPFIKQTGISINLESTRNLTVALAQRQRDNDPPDLVVLPNPAQVRQLASRQQLFRLDAFLDMQTLRRNYGSAWLDLASYQGDLYALIQKAANKGTIWYSPAHFKDRGYQIPRTWQELLALSAEIAASGQHPWSIGLASAASSGWPAADWIAEIYLRQFGPDLYDQWVNHQLHWADASVRRAFQLFGQIAGGKGYVQGAPQSILDTTYQHACYAPFAAPPQAYMNYLGDFAIGFLTSQFPEARPGSDFDFFQFPTLDPRYSGAVTVSADFVVAMSSNQTVQQFLQYLATAPAQAIWVKRGGAISLNKEVDLANYPNDVARASAQMLLTAPTFRFSADDLMPFAVEQAFWQQIQHFIVHPSDLDSILNAIETVARVNYST